jgi:hypothetical protein
MGGVMQDYRDLQFVAYLGYILVAGYNDPLIEQSLCGSQCPEKQGLSVEVCHELVAAKADSHSGCHYDTTGFGKEFSV